MEEDVMKKMVIKNFNTDIQYKSNVLNDLFILDLNFMLWINISLNGLKTNPIFA
jgi:hypothetical protein